MTQADARPTAEPLTGRLAGGGAHKQTLADSLITFVGQDTYRTDGYAFLHRFVFLLGLNDHEQLFGSSHHDRKTRLTSTPLDRITRTTEMRALRRRHAPLPEPPTMRETSISATGGRLVDMCDAGRGSAILSG